MSDEEIASWLGTRLRPNTASETRLSKERETTEAYYAARLPAPLHKGNSKYVSQDVHDSVDAMRAALLEVFAGNRVPFEFEAVGPADVPLAEQATALAEKVIFRQNKGYLLMHTVLTDGLLHRNGIAQAYWLKDESWEEVETPELPPEQAAMILEEHQAQGVKLRNPKVALSDDETLARLSYEKLVVRSRIVVEAVPLEEFGISPRAPSLADAEMVYRAQRRSRGWLLRAGYDRRIIEDIWEDDHLWQETSPEILERHRETDDGNFASDSDDSGSPNGRRNIMVYTVYTDLDVNRSGIPQKHEVIYCGGRVLAKRPVRCHPFLSFAPMPKAHAFWGDNFAARVIPTQNARSLLVRSIIDHAIVTTNPRWTVTRGGLVNPKELLENRIGGIVNQTRDGAVQPLMQPPLNPFVFQTIGLLDEDKEEATGISKLSQGLNKDAVSKQNSNDMVQGMVSNSKERQKIIARNFAEGFLTELVLLVYQLAIENMGPQELEVNGRFVPVDPSKWEERDSVKVEFRLGHGEQDKEVQKYLQVDAYLSQAGNPAPDPYLKLGYGPAQRFHTLSKALKAMGIKDVENHIAPPQAIEPPQPDPLQQALATVPLREIAVKEAQVGITEFKAQAEAARKLGDQGLKAAREQNDVRQEDESLDLKREELDHTRRVDAADIAIRSTEADARMEVARNPPKRSTSGD
jgi:hypothetical protein